MECDAAQSLPEGLEAPEIRDAIKVWYARCVHGVCTVCARCAHGVCTVCARCAHGVCTVCVCMGTCMALHGTAWHVHEARVANARARHALKGSKAPCTGTACTQSSSVGHALQLPRAHTTPHQESFDALPMLYQYK